MYTLKSFCDIVLKAEPEIISEKVNKKIYRKFNIPKKNGVRTICCLDGSSELSIIQKNLLDNFLNKQVVPVCVKGFRKRESYNSFLLPHVGANFFFRIDIKDFFPSIKKDLIKKEFSNIINCINNEEKEKILEVISEIVCLDGILPQGACTSPSVSNIVMARTDQRILKYCQALDITYTRYADDLLFSSKIFPFREKKWFLKKIKHILGNNGFEINYSKLRYGKENIVFNGYVLSCDGIRLSRKRLHDIRKIVLFVKNNSSKIRIGDKIGFLNDINMLELKYRDLERHPFNSVFQVSQYMCGYRAFLISLLNEELSDYYFQKEIKRLIRKIEKQVKKIS